MNRPEVTPALYSPDHALASNFLLSTTKRVREASRVSRRTEIDTNFAVPLTLNYAPGCVPA